MKKAFEVKVYGMHGRLAGSWSLEQYNITVYYLPVAGRRYGLINLIMARWLDNLLNPNHRIVGAPE